MRERPYRPLPPSHSLRAGKQNRENRIRLVGSLSSNLVAAIKNRLSYKIDTLVEIPVFGHHPVGLHLRNALLMLEPALILTLEVSSKLPLRFQKRNVG